MRIHAWTPAMLALTLPVLTGCDGTPVAPRTDPVEAIPEFSQHQATEKEMACVNNLKQIGISSHDHDKLGLIIHDPSVDVSIGSEIPVAGTFFGHMLAGRDGDACGVAYLEFDEAIDQGDQAIVGVVLAFAGAAIHEELERRVMTFEGYAELCPYRDGPCHTARLTGEVEVSQNLGLWKFDISDMARGGLEFAVAAETHTLLPGPGQDVERLRLNVGPTPVWVDDRVIATVSFDLTGAVGTAAIAGKIEWRPSAPERGTDLIQVQLGLLLSEGDGYRWLLHAVVQTERPVYRLHHSEVRLWSGSELQSDDTWSDPQASYGYSFDGFRIIDIS
jgi:hypothetical protein